MRKEILIGIIGVLIIITLANIVRITTPLPPSHIEPIILTNTETIYQEIEVLKIKQDTIKLYYEKKINIYRALPTPDRVKLFAKRINQ